MAGASGGMGKGNSGAVIPNPPGAGKWHGVFCAAGIRSGTVLASDHFGFYIEAQLSEVLTMSFYPKRNAGALR
jgi:hypothetical protein